MNPLWALLLSTEIGTMTLFAQSQFERTISLGQVITAILIAVAALVGIIYGAKWKVTAETAIASADELRKSLSDSLEREAKKEEGLRQQSEVNADLREQIKILDQRPDLTVLVTLFKDTFLQLDAASSSRHEGILHQFEANTEVLHKVLAELRKQNGVEE